MLNNAGNKIVLWSKIILILGIAVSVIFGFFIIWNGTHYPVLRYSYYHMGTVYQSGYAGGYAIIKGFLVMIFGSLSAWLTALLLTALGELSVNAKAIRENLEYRPFHHTHPHQSAPVNAAASVAGDKAEAAAPEQQQAAPVAQTETPTEETDQHD